jgi:hypothetical protein
LRATDTPPIYFDDFSHYLILTTKGQKMIKFSTANTKLKKLYKVKALKRWLRNKRKVYSFDLLSGWACPFASQCRSKAAIDENGKRRIKDGPNTKFRCFSASQEVQYTGVYEKRKLNFDTLKKCRSKEEMIELILSALPDDAGIVRVHVSGDFFNLIYFLAWCEVARLNPDRLFYAYTKSIPYWVAELGSIPENLVLTASRGGTHDSWIVEHGLPEAVVCYSEFEAGRLGLEIDTDDSHAAIGGKSFALIIHGTQPKGSEAGKAWNEIRLAKIGG